MSDVFAEKIWLIDGCRAVLCFVQDHEVCWEEIVFQRVRISLFLCLSTGCLKVPALSGWRLVGLAF